MIRLVVIMLFMLMGCSSRMPYVQMQLRSPITGEKEIHIVDWRVVQVREIWVERVRGKMRGFAIIAPWCTTHQQFLPILVREWTGWDLRTEMERYMARESITEERIDRR